MKTNARWMMSGLVLLGWMAGIGVDCGQALELSDLISADAVKNIVLDNVKKVVDQATKDAQKMAQGVIDKAADQAKSVVAEAGKRAQDVIDAGQAKADKIMEEARQQIQAAGAGGEEADKILALAQERADQVIEDSKTCAGKIEKEAKEFADAVKANASKTSEAILKELDNLANTVAKELVSSDDIGDKASKIASAAGDSANKICSMMLEFGESVAGEFTQTVNDLKGVVGEFAGKVGDGLSETVDDLKGVVEGWAGGLKDTVTGEGKSFAQTVTNAAMNSFSGKALVGVDEGEDGYVVSTDGAFDQSVHDNMNWDGGSATMDGEASGSGNANGGVVNTEDGYSFEGTLEGQIDIGGAISAEHTVHIPGFGDITVSGGAFANLSAEGVFHAMVGPDGSISLDGALNAVFEAGANFSISFEGSPAMQAAGISDTSDLFGFLKQLTNDPKSAVQGIAGNLAQYGVNLAMNWIMEKVGGIAGRLQEIAGAFLPGGGALSDKQLAGIGKISDMLENMARQGLDKVVDQLKLPEGVDFGGDATGPVGGSANVKKTEEKTWGIRLDKN